MADRILIRCFGGEPRVMYRVPGGAARITIAATPDAPEHQRIGWPVGDAFVLNDRLARHLRRTYKAGDRDALALLWKQASPLLAAQKRKD